MSDIVPVTITSIRQVGPRVKVFTLTPVDDPLHFSAGQWVDCYVEIDGELLVGGYSLTSSPLEGPDVELAIKQAHENRVTPLPARARGDRRGDHPGWRPG